MVYYLYYVFSTRLGDLTLEVSDLTATNVQLRIGAATAAAQATVHALEVRALTTSVTIVSFGG